MSTKTRSETRRIESIDFEALPHVLGPLEMAMETLVQGARAETLVDQVLRAHRHWPHAHRKVFVETLYAVAIWRRRLFFHSGSYSPKAMLGALLRDLAQLPEAQQSRLFPMTDVSLPPPKTPKNLGERYSFPDWLVDELILAVGDAAECLADSLNFPGPICLRTNLLKTTVESLQHLLKEEGVETEPASHAPFALNVTSERPNILGLGAHQSGLFEVQDEGSQLLAHLLDVKPEDSVLDFCAGAGGKTLAFASAMRNQGQIHAYDIDEKRLSRLKTRAERAGVKNLSIHTSLPENLQVDQLFVDAPCSELGVLRRGPDRRFHITPDSVREFPKLQKEILKTALRYLKPGGRLVYATCTFRKPENEDVASWLETEFPALHRVRSPKPFLAPFFTYQAEFKSFPHTHSTDAFFACRYEYLP